MQTRSGKTYTISSSLENNTTRVETKVDTTLDNRVKNRLRQIIRPRVISNELAKFLGKPTGTEMLRTDVARHINGYIRSNNLQDNVNGRIINADEKLRKLLKLRKNDELTYFNINKYMNHHFIV